MVWPAKLPAGAVRGQFATGADWLPTIADILDIDVDDLGLDGHSLLPIIEAEDAESAYDNYLWELDSQGQAVEKLTPAPFLDTQLVGSPDGSQLAS